MLDSVLVWSVRFLPPTLKTKRGGSQIDPGCSDIEHDRSSYGVEESEEGAGAQPAARGRHVGQLQPDVPPGIIRLHQGQRMLPVPEQNRVKLEQEDLVPLCVCFITVKPAGMQSGCSHNGH